jgi:hypothetical protein
VVGALLLAAAGRRHPRTPLLPAAAPLLAAVGLAPLYAAAAGSLRGAAHRLWAAVAGVAAIVGWQVMAGAEGLLFSSTPVPSGWDALAGVTSPLEAADVLTRPLRDQPEALLGGAVLVVGALLVPTVMRLRAGAPRLAGAVAWVVALTVAAAALGAGQDRIIETFLPSCILVAVWAARPWRLLARPETRSAPTHGGRLA